MAERDGCPGRTDVSGATVPGPAAAADGHAARPGPVDPDGLIDRAAEVLEGHWRPPGFCVPNAATYPWQWLWDSCFHAVCWARLGRADRARTELANALRHQSGDGFVPHITYWSSRSAPPRADDDTHAAFWGRPATSSITQPPMYGHAVAELVRRGVDVEPELVDRAARGLRFLLEARTRDGVGPLIVHPWESGCDDSPRWDGWGDFDPALPDGRVPRWRQTKGDLVAALRPAVEVAPDRSGAGSASVVASTAFEVVAAGFTALVAFNAAELAEVTGQAALGEAAAGLAAALDARWSASRATWLDRVVTGPSSTSGVRTLDALLPVLVSQDPAAVDVAFAQLADPEAFGADCGPTGVDRREPTFDPRTYWRGPAWPQLTYLLWVAAQRRGRRADADRLAAALTTGAVRSGLAEYWDPDTGQGLGAVPQSWAALAAVVV